MVTGFAGKIASAGTRATGRLATAELQALERAEIRTATLAGKVEAQTGIQRLQYITTNGLRLETTPGRTTTVIGRYSDDLEK